MTAAALHGFAPAPVATPRRERSMTPDAATQTAIAAERGYLLRVARGQLRDRMLAEDVVHDALLAALQSASGFAGRSSLRTWLTSILHHRIADALRSLHRVRELSVGSTVAEDADSNSPDEYCAPAEIDHRDPPHVLEGRQTVLALTQGLQRLAPMAAQVLLLRQVEGCSNDETAQRLQLDPSQVPAILHRARRRLERLASEPVRVQTMA